MNSESTQNFTVKIEMTVNEVNIVIGALQELPHKVVDSLLRKIIEQGQTQLQQTSDV